MSDERIIKIIRSAIMHDNEASLHKALMRQAQGSRAKAFHIIRESAKHYGLSEVKVEDYHIDCALAELNGGVEVEWPAE